MANKSTTASYSFGQLGSVFSSSTASIKPPTGKVFVAITALADATFGKLINEPNFFGTSTKASAHISGDIVTAPTGAWNVNDVNTMDVIVDNSTSLGIKKGMRFYHETLAPRSDSTVWRVVSVTGETESAKVVTLDHAVAADHLIGATDQLGYFHHMINGQGSGGIAWSGATQLGEGYTIFGRWSSFKLNGGTAIAYIGE
jgi:hypothetical protein